MPRRADARAEAELISRTSRSFGPLLVALAFLAAPVLVATGPGGASLVARAADALMCPGDDVTGDPMPEGSGHSHVARLQHLFATPGLEPLGRIDPSPPSDGAAPVWDPPTDSLDHAANGARFGEVDVRDGRAYLAHIGSPTGVYIIDVKVPAEPRLLGTWRSGSGGYVTDVKVSNDGNSIYATTQSAGSKSGVYLVDVRDPANPRTMQFERAQPNGIHMLWVHPLPGKDAEMLYGATAYGGGVEIYVSVGLPNGSRRMVAFPEYDSSSAPHDVAVYHDLLLGKPIMAIADGGDGFSLTDVSNPGMPTEIARWSYSGTERFYAHTIRAGIVEGKRIVIVSPEGGALGLGSNSVAKLWIFDATNLNDVRVLGTWGNPGGHRAGSFTLSTHNFQWVDGKIYLAHYHGGVWVFDASSVAALSAPRPLAYRLLTDHTVSRTTPDVWDVVVNRGITIAADINGGLYTMHYRCDATGDEGPTSYG